MVSNSTQSERDGRNSRRKLFPTRQKPLREDVRDVEHRSEPVVSPAGEIDVYSVNNITSAIVFLNSNQALGI